MSCASSSSKEFPDRLRAARELRGFSQGDLAERAGFQPSAISHFESGRRAPSFDNLKRLADVLTVSTDYLLGRAQDLKGAAAATGPVIARIFRNAEKLTQEDLATIEDLAEVLAKKQMRKDKEG